MSVAWPICRMDIHVRWFRGDWFRGDWHLLILLMPAGVSKRSNPGHSVEVQEIVVRTIKVRTMNRSSIVLTQIVLTKMRFEPS